MRSYLRNVGNRFRIGQLITASIIAPSTGALWIPISARIDLGTKGIAFTKNHGVFSPKVIVTAQQSGEWIEVVNGLTAQDSVAYQAHFLMDTDSFIKVNYGL